MTARFASFDNHFIERKSLHLKEHGQIDQGIVLQGFEEIKASQYAEKLIEMLPPTSLFRFVEQFHLQSGEIPFFFEFKSDQTSAAFTFKPRLLTAEFRQTHVTFL